LETACNCGVGGGNILFYINLGFLFRNVTTLLDAAVLFHPLEAEESNNCASRLHAIAAASAAVMYYTNLVVFCLEMGRRHWMPPFCSIHQWQNKATTVPQNCMQRRRRRRRRYIILIWMFCLEMGRRHWTPPFCSIHQWQNKATTVHRDCMQRRQRTIILFGLSV
jgi:hypothetical protein